MIVIYGKETKELAEEFSRKIGLKCEFCDSETYDFQVLEVLEIPVIFILDRSDSFTEFLMLKEKDPKDIRAYRRRYLNNLRYFVLKGLDGGFSLFIDEKLKELGGKRIQKISELSEETISELRETISKFKK